MTRAVGICRSMAARARLNQRGPRSRIALSAVATISGDALRTASGLNNELGVPGPALRGGGLEDQALEPAAVGNRAIEEPVATGNIERGQHVADEPEGGEGLLDLAVGAVDTGQVAEGAVAAAEDHGPAQSRLDRRQHVEAIEDDRLAGNRRGAHFLPQAARAGRVRATAPPDRHPLALGQ